MPCLSCSAKILKVILPHWSAYLIIMKLIHEYSKLKIIIEGEATTGQIPTPIDGWMGEIVELKQERIVIKI